MIQAKNSILSLKQLALLFGGTINMNVLVSFTLLAMSLGIAHASQDIPPADYGTVVDGVGGPRDGVPDEVWPDFFAVLNRVPPGQEERGVAEFNISGLPGSQDSAILTGEGFYNTTGPETLELWGYVGDGSVYLPDFDSGDVLIATFLHTEGPLSIDVRDFLNDRINAGDTYLGFAIRQPAQRPGRKSWINLRLTTIGAFVDIDIKPGSYPSSINLKSKGLTPVAIHTTDDFDATTVDPETVELEGVPAVQWEIYDCDELPNPLYGLPGEPEMIGDGDPDLVVYFETQALAAVLSLADTEATLTGQTFGGLSIEGTGDVSIVVQGKP